MRASGRVRRLGWRVAYELIAFRAPAGRPFLNYGWVPEDGAPRPELRPDDERWRRSIQLYDRVAGAVDLSGLDVLDVGCGRGGGSSYVARYLGPKRVLGVDFSRREIARRRREAAVPGLEFRFGDAEALPLPDESFDAVLSVESSHCYGSPNRFAFEVARVLRPGGHLLWADLGPAGFLDRMRDAFAGAGLEPVDEEDLTPGVLRSLQRTEARASTPATRSEFAAAPGTTVFTRLEEARFRYLRRVLVKR